MKKIWNKRIVKRACVIFGITALILGLVFLKRESLGQNNKQNPDKVSRVYMKTDKEITGFAQKVRKKKINEKEQKLNKTHKPEEAKKIVEKTAQQTEEEEYFTTSIIDGEVITVREYSFRIYQLNNSLSLIDTRVYVNGNQSDFHGRVHLAKAENNIRVCCYYRNEKNKKIEIEKNYIVYVDMEHIVLCTDLENNIHVKSKQISFEAYGYYQGKQLGAQVFLNKEELIEGEAFQYQGQLTEGKNTIQIQVRFEGKRAEKLIAVFLDVEKAKNEEKPKTEVVGTGEDTEENAPVLTCNLSDGKTVNNEKLNFQVNAKDYKGQWLDQTHFQVTCGGNKASMIYANEDQISYRVHLVEGYNVVLIKVEDKEGHEAKKAYSITYKKLENGLVGNATISVEATTVGCGYLVSKTKVEIKENTNAAQILCQLLERNNYIVEYGGSLESGFYLARISKEEEFMSPKIPKDLQKHLQAVDEEFPGDYYKDSLGEFDFSYGSGWMYQVNGIYPNYGFSDCYLQDGDELRVRFTLHYGADIGGAMAKGNGGNEGDSGNWEKEW